MRPASTRTGPGAAPCAARVAHVALAHPDREAPAGLVGVAGLPDQGERR